MADATLSLIVAVVVIVVLCVFILAGFWLHLDAAREWRAERTDLLNRVLAETPRELVALQKASRPKPDIPGPAEPEHHLIGTY